MKSRNESFAGMFFRMLGRAMAEQADDPFGTGDFQLMAALFAKDRAHRLKLVMAKQFANMEGEISIFDGPEGSTIITERNKKAFEVLRREIAKGRKKIAVFYGAGHLPDMQRRLEQDFQMQQTGTDWVTAWSLIPSERLHEAAAATNTIDVSTLSPCGWSAPAPLPCIRSCSGSGCGSSSGRVASRCGPATRVWRCTCGIAGMGRRRCRRWTSSSGRWQPVRLIREFPSAAPRRRRSRLPSRQGSRAFRLEAASQAVCEDGRRQRHEQRWRHAGFPLCTAPDRAAVVAPAFRPGAAPRASPARSPRPRRDSGR